MADHHIENIGGDFIYFCGHPNPTGNRYDKYIDQCQWLLKDLNKKVWTCVLDPCRVRVPPFSLEDVAT